MVAAAAGWDENAPTVRRRLLAITAIVCLALCIALAGVQVYARQGTIRLPTPSRACALDFTKQGLVIRRVSDTPNAPDSANKLTGMGFTLQRLTYRLSQPAPAPHSVIHATPITMYHAILPYWFLYTLLLVAPGGWVWGRYRRRRQGRGFPVILAGEGERQPNG